MTITYEKGLYICRCSFTERKIPDRAGFTFDPRLKKWVTAKPRIATRLREHFDGEAKKTIKAYTLRKMPWSGRLSFPKNESLRPWQVKGAKFALRRNNTYLAFEQRLGKTPTSIAVMNSLPKKTEAKSLPTLIIVPPFKLLDWVDDLERWSVPKRRVFTIGASNYLLGFEHPSDYDVVLLSDTMITSDPVAAFLKSWYYELLIVDEAHRFSNEGTNRTDALYGENGITKQCNRTVLLSGTPLSNRPAELYPCLRALAWNIIDYMTFQEYAFKYCNGRMVRVTRTKEVLDYSGASNLDDLYKKLRRFMIVEKLSDHAKVVSTHRLVTVTPTGSLGKPKKLERGGLNTKGFNEYFEGESELGDIATYRNELAEQKLKPATEFVLNKVQTEKRSILIFGVHRVVTEGLYNALKKKGESVELIVGGITKTKRRDIEKRFQSGKTRIIVAQVETMVGVDLYKGAYCIFVESPWSPRAIHQAASRPLSFMKKGEVFFDHLVLKDTFEEYVLSRALEKTESINKVIKPVNTNERGKL